MLLTDFIIGRKYYRMSGWATCLKGVGMAGRNKERSEITDKGVELSKLETESGTFYRGRYQRMVAGC